MKTKAGRPPVVVHPEEWKADRPPVPVGGVSRAGQGPRRIDNTTTEEEHRNSRDPSAEVEDANEALPNTDRRGGTELDRGENGVDPDPGVDIEIPSPRINQGRRGTQSRINSRKIGT